MHGILLVSILDRKGGYYQLVSFLYYSTVHSSTTVQVQLYTYAAAALLQLKTRVSVSPPHLILQARTLLARGRFHEDVSEDLELRSRLNKIIFNATSDFQSIQVHIHDMYNYIQRTGPKPPLPRTPPPVLPTHVPRVARHGLLVPCT